MKIAVVTAVPTPYRDPFWNELASRQGVEVHVFYCAAGQADHPWEVDWEQRYRAEVMPGYNLLGWRGPTSRCYWNPCVGSRLRSDEYDAVVIGGYNHPTMCLAMLTAARRRIPYYLVCESSAHKSGSWWKQWIKTTVVKRVVRNAAGGLPTGVQAEANLLSYGMHESQLCRMPNTPDFAQLKKKVDENRLNRTELRREHFLDERPKVIFLGRLIEKKRPHLLLDAWLEADRTRSWQLILAGDGPLREDLITIVRRRGLEGDVKLPGYIRPSEVAKWLAMADLFVLPSSETWGVVVLEALAAGLRVIVTDEVGCHPDVICSERVGTIVPARDRSALVQALVRQMASPQDAEAVDAAWEPVQREMDYGTVSNRLLQLLSRQEASPERLPTSDLGDSAQVDDRFPDDRMDKRAACLTTIRSGADTRSNSPQ